MPILVFVTDDGSERGTGPLLFLPTRPDAALPPHPRSMSWRYFATVGEGDSLLGPDTEHTLDEIRRKGFCIARRLV